MDLLKKCNREMEVEVKLRLPDSAAHHSDLLSPFHTRTHLQENIFFDGAAGELSSKRAVLRLRFYNSDTRCVVSLKAKAVLFDMDLDLRRRLSDMEIADATKLLNLLQNLSFTDHAECWYRTEIHKGFTIRSAAQMLGALRRNCDG